MEYSATTVRLESDLKRQFDSICKSMGMNANVAFNIFARAVVKEKGIPFVVETAEKKHRTDAMASFRALRSVVEQPSFPEISEEEIEQEISAYRSEK